METTQERVCVFLDWCDLVRSLQRLHVNVRLDFKRLKNWIVASREASPIRYYTGDLQSEPSKRDNFYSLLRRSGYEVVISRHPYSHASSANEEYLRAACHSAMVWDMCNLSQTGDYTSFVLVSGAGQFGQVVDWVQQRGVKVEVVFFERLTNNLLLKKAHKFTEIHVPEVSLNIRRRIRRNSRQEACA